MKITTTPRTFTIEANEEELKYLYRVVGDQTGGDEDRLGVSLPRVGTGIFLSIERALDE